MCNPKQKVPEYRTAIFPLEKGSVSLCYSKEMSEADLEVFEDYIRVFLSVLKKCPAERMISRLRSTAIGCPKCAHETDLASCDYALDYVTYWGERGPIGFECPSCGHGMQVEETVMRSFEIVETTQ